MVCGSRPRRWPLADCASLALQRTRLAHRHRAKPGPADWSMGRFELTGRAGAGSIVRVLGPSRMQAARRTHWFEVVYPLRCARRHRSRAGSCRCPVNSVMICAGHQASSGIDDTAKCSGSRGG
jgi:hypothetical protein